MTADKIYPGFVSGAIFSHEWQFYKQVPNHTSLCMGILHVKDIAAFGLLGWHSQSHQSGSNQMLNLVACNVLWSGKHFFKKLMFKTYTILWLHENAQGITFEKVKYIIKKTYRYSLWLKLQPDEEQISSSQQFLFWWLSALCIFLDFETFWDNVPLVIWFFSPL